MVRGRRNVIRNKNVTSDGSSGEPRKKSTKLSQEFKGRLSHSVPRLHDVEITKYFHPDDHDENLPLTLKTSQTDCELSGHESNTDSNAVVKTEEKDGNDSDENNSILTPQKANFTKNKTPLSPASALSLLQITATPKKATKSRRRLNPSQIANQQAPAALAPAGSRVRPTFCPPSVKGKKVTALFPDSTQNHKLTEYFPVRRSERKTKKIVLEEWQKTIEEAILSEKEEGLEVHNFEGKGRGIVTTRDFHKGEFVVEYAGELISMTEAKVREALYAQDQNTGCYMYYFKHKNTQYCVDATAETGRLGRLVNHSRNGNLVTKTVTVENKPRLVLVAKEDIPAGEEVMYDYGDRSKESIRHHPWLTS
ncbi:histone-lysine N-methyltransferase PR-Set7 [Schistocerca nitens]|uniref:histone-lysine N-methyltransferase PR-Set7 n=1 Tax=Schistocerca nitens TaxID=7011 RepID=UPI0021190ED2|nr:histone-lysine N-methyltransferase PR-Set7 [Schistocerca nitens]